MLSRMSRVIIMMITGLAADAVLIYFILFIYLHMAMFSLG